MPLDLTCDTDEVIGLDEYVDHIAATDLTDRDAILATAPKLRALANDRRFLLDLIVQQVLDRRREGRAFVQRYTPNVFVLAHRKGYFVRAIIWPPATHALTDGEKQVFSFELPHDHNFDFMTVGYQGPGYETDLFEYDIKDVVGYPGEQVNLVPKGRWQLAPGRVWFFRRGIDVHTQLPPPATSISLNLLLDPPCVTAQYQFDVERGTILGNIHHYARASLLACVAPLLGEDAADRLSPLCDGHPDEQVRVAAYQAVATRLGKQAWEPALRDRSVLVQRLAARALG
jgi:hypothetical protein